MGIGDLFRRILGQRDHADSETITISIKFDFRRPEKTPEEIAEEEEAKHQREERKAYLLSLDPLCPYCGRCLDKMPTRKRKCPSCDETFWVRTTNTLFDSALLTEDQAWAVEHVGVAQVIGLDLDGIRTNAERTGSWKTSTQRLVEERVSQVAPRLEAEERWDDLASLHNYAEAVHNPDSDRSLYHDRQKMIAEIKGWRADGFESVRITCDHDAPCQACRIDRDRVLTFDDAINFLPLPHDDCTCENPPACLCKLHPVGGEREWEWDE